MPGLADRALHPATGRFRWFIAAIFLSPLTGYISTAIVAVTALLEALRLDKIVRALRASRPARVTATIMLVFFLSIFLSDLIHQRGHRWWSDLKYLLPIVGPLLLFIRLSDMKISHDDIGRLALIASGITIVVTVSQHLYYAKIMGVPGWRSAALSGNTLFVSAMFVPMLLLSWLGFEKRDRFGQSATVAIFSGGAAALAIALGARAGFMTILVMTPIVLVFVLSRIRIARSRKIGIVLTAAFALAGLAIALPFISPEFAQRMSALLAGLQNFDASSTNDASAISRLQHWRAGLEAVLDRPWSGYGFRKDTIAVARHLPEGALVLPTIHQQYLSFGITAGIFGILAGVAYLALPIINAFGVQGSERNNERLYAAAALAAPIMLNGLTDTIFDDMRIQGFYSVMIMVLLCARADNEKPASLPA